MMRLNVAPLNNIVPETIVPALPFLFHSEDHMHAVLDEPIGDEILAAMEKANMVGLAFYESGARSMYATRPIRTLADIQHRKIRVQQSDLSVAMVETLGANATPMPCGEVYTGLKTGIIGAVENNFPSYESSRHFKAAKHYTLTEPGATHETGWRDLTIYWGVTVLSLSMKGEWRCRSRNWSSIFQRSRIAGVPTRSIIG